jgi:hypothetical protein
VDADADAGYRDLERTQRDVRYGFVIQLLQVMSLLSDPNFSSPANVDASVSQHVVLAVRGFGVTSSLSISQGSAEDGQRFFL